MAAQPRVLVVGAMTPQRRPISAMRNAVPAATTFGAGHAAAAAAGLSIVMPVHNEAAGLAALHDRICAVAAKLAEQALACEIVYVDDGSHDGSLDVARALPAAGIDVQWC